MNLSKQKISRVTLILIITLVLFSLIYIGETSSTSQTFDETYQSSGQGPQYYLLPPVMMDYYSGQQLNIDFILAKGVKNMTISIEGQKVITIRDFSTRHREFKFDISGVLSISLYFTGELQFKMNIDLQKLANYQILTIFILSIMIVIAELGNIYLKSREKKILQTSMTPNQNEQRLWKLYTVISYGMNNLSIFIFLIPYLIFGSDANLVGIQRIYSYGVSATYSREIEIISSYQHLLSLGYLQILFAIPILHFRQYYFYSKDNTNYNDLLPISTRKKLSLNIIIKTVLLTFIPAISIVTAFVMYPQTMTKDAIPSYLIAIIMMFLVLIILIMINELVWFIFRDYKINIFLLPVLYRLLNLAPIVKEANIFYFGFNSFVYFQKIPNLSLFIITRIGVFILLILSIIYCDRVKMIIEAFQSRISNFLEKALAREPNTE